MPETLSIREQQHTIHSFTYFLPLQDNQGDDHDLADQKPSQGSCLGVATVAKQSNAA